ncbi:uncharacterized protein SCHCODRAFT_02505445 [Schizophyllum commune H4-8]|nr:uncharacterized protein SCHCODRAFT_02505445 [Schizophyllum commune H4-8]KAI5891356.1 hypothetical protein SCHCODRAFT_02505445 [Schizophyllum commune H4-8]
MTTHDIPADFPPYEAHYYASTNESSNQTAVLSSAEKVLHGATAVDNWRTVIQQKAPSPSKEATRAYMLLLAPPYISGTRTRPELRHWGAAPDPEADEIFSLQELEEFESSDFSYLDRVPVSKRMSRSSTPDPSPKRRKLYTAPLYDLLPKPHVFVSPVTSKIKMKDLKAYNRRKPIILDPDVQLSAPFSRNTWIIPIRGKLSWDECSSAALFDPSNESAIPFPPTPTDNEILWTRDAISQFWQFLIYFRQKGRLGPIGLSFQVSSVQPISGSASSGSATAHNDISSLDHVRIHHDGQLSMHVRNILHLWAYRANEGDSGIRMLRGARLLLVNHKGKALLIS